MPKIKIRDFKGLNTNYDSADINTDFFIKYINICTKHGYIIPEGIKIEKFMTVNNIVYINEVYLDSDKLANKLLDSGYWSRSESNYIQNINKYLLIVTNKEIQLYDNQELLKSYNYYENNSYITDVKLINNKGIAKVTINNQDIFVIRYISRNLRYLEQSKYYHGFIIDEILPENKLDVNFGIFTKTYVNDNGKIFSDYVKDFYKLERETSFPFKGLHPYYNGVSKTIHPTTFNIIYKINDTKEGGTDYYLFEGKKYKLVGRTNNNSINSYNENMKLLGLGCIASNEIGFIKYVINGINYYAIIKEHLFTFVESNIYNNIKNNYINSSYYNDIYEWDNHTLSWEISKGFWWGYRKNGSIDYKLRSNYSLNANWILFSESVIDDFINKLNSEVYLPKVHHLFDIDAEGLILGNKLEIVTTIVYDNNNEIVCNYWSKNVDQTISKSVIELYWDEEDILGINLSKLNNRINKIYFYYRLNSNSDFEQFHIIDLQTEYNDHQSYLYISLNSRSGVYLTQTIGYAYQPSDFETNHCNKALIKPNNILEVNGIQMSLFGQNIVYPAIGRGRILEDIYYRMNIIPDIEGDWLVNISNNLGVYNKDKKELAILEVRNQENILLFYLKESIPYIINKYNDIIYTPLGIITLTNKGIVLFDSKQNTLLSENINNIIEEKYQVSNIYYDIIRQQLHFITNNQWFKYDFQMKVWNEYTLPEDVDTPIIPNKLINLYNELYISFNSNLYKISYINNVIGFIELVKFQNLQNNIKIKINDVSFDEEQNNIRFIVKEFISLHNRKYYDYLNYKTNIINKTYSLELDVEMIELDNMVLTYKTR